MTFADIENKKRKRKHKSKKGEEASAAEAQSIGTTPVEKSRKKAKKEHTPELEVEDVAADVPADGTDSEAEEDEAQLNKELKQIAADAKAADVEEAEEVNGSGANNEALGSLSMPTLENPTRFEELKLSDRTMEAIKTMGFETMTEIQQKTIPPLLRYDCTPCPLNIHDSHSTVVKTFSERPRREVGKHWLSSSLLSKCFQPCDSSPEMAPESSSCHPRENLHCRSSALPVS